MASALTIAGAVAETTTKIERSFINFGRTDLAEDELMSGVLGAQPKKACWTKLTCKPEPEGPC
ncbi:hypothetical protein IscW_ISCW007272 [Ixodes scapularis]|uniref:Uncharacterized protein n=1 Tax=Ixodes scapularis TaxID=6945 RepID=B7PSC5_IXOSC|nr:hypothetical protein IscW_ISCW007272 [Ixodes scapularis]|eukprot:XP_002402187.1 hypothetical protein IscW_ISCW007272 [Ixodes scapularis]